MDTSTNQLIALGLKAREAKIYLTLLEIGIATAASLAKRTGENRTTVYAVLNKLLDKGLIAKDQQELATYFWAEEPNKLVTMLEDQSKQLLAKTKEAKQIADQLKPFHKKEGSLVPKNKVFIGESGLKEIFTKYQDLFIDEAVKNDPNKIWWGYRKGQFSSSHFYDILYKQWVEKHSKTGVTIRVLTHSKEKPPSLGGARLAKVMPPGYDLFDGVLWLAGDMIAMFYEETSPPFGVVTHDRVMAQTIRSMLQFIWDHV